MSLPRRQTSSFPRVWSPGRSAGVLVFFWTMIFWGTTQAVLTWARVDHPLDLLRLTISIFPTGNTGGCSATSSSTPGLCIFL